MLLNLTATELLYPVFITLTFLMTIIFIPKERYKNYLIYGIMIGLLGDVFLIALFQNVLKIIRFKNQGFVWVLGQNAFSPLGWTLAVMLFLYFLPGRKWFRYFYILAWGLLSLGFAYVARNADLFDFQPWFYPLPAYLLFLCWHSFAAWLYLSTNGEDSKEK